jgi:hypothetical protein
MLDHSTPSLVLHRSRSWAAALAAVAFLGCKSSDGGGASNVPSNDFAAQYASAYCESIGPCCAQAGIASDVESCRSTLQPTLAATVKILLENPKITYNESATGICLDEIRASLTACTDRTRAASKTCQQVFVGTVPIGGACATSNDCVKQAGGSVYCSQAVCTWSGNQTEQPRGKLGDGCNATCQAGNGTTGCAGWGVSDAGSSTTCWISDGLYCPIGRVCTAVAAIGQRCSGNYSCVEDAHCQNGACVANEATGPCTSQFDCLRTYCDYTSQQCSPRKANGETCSGDDSQCAGGDCYQSKCRTWTQATAATCAGLLDD